MRNIIFLDVDGVLNRGQGKPLQPGKIKKLSELVLSTDSELILHSGWRFWFDSYMRPLTKEAAKLTKMLQSEGLKLSGKTPDLSTEEIRRTRKYSLIKAEEILLYIRNDPEIGKWIVIDDLNLHNKEVKIHQIQRL